MTIPISRRNFITGATKALPAAMGALTMLNSLTGAGAEENPLPFPLVDLHVHRDNSTLDKILALSAERGIKFGIVEHAGDKDNVYPVVLKNDEELLAYIATFEGKPCYKGVQAEWTNWMDCFSKEALSKLDYVLTDTFTFPDKNGKRMKMWEKGADIGDKATFMDRYIDWHIQIISTEPIDILANTSWLPEDVAADYDALWTDARITKVMDAALKYGVAIEISSGFKLPKLAFLRTAKEAGVKFSFGSNGRYPSMGKLEYSVQMAKELGLAAADTFTPAPDGQKAVQRRMK